MRIPQEPPDFTKQLTDAGFFTRAESFLRGQEPHTGGYIHWDKLRRLPNPPAGLSHEDWWAAIKIGRMRGLKSLPLKSKSGNPFQFSVPDEVAEQLHQIDMGGGGKIGMPEALPNTQVRDQYVISSLIQEAITSSQLEGAVTTREVAKEMLRTGRPPRDRSERMILNNFMTMQRVAQLRTEKLSPELVYEIHKLVTDGTLRNPDAAGRLRRSDEEVRVEDESGEVFHTPPNARELPERMQTMCDFANGLTPASFIHPAIRSILLHFWIGYDHPFVDGNGRTARALFYWSMLRREYWLFEFISISDILHRAPAKYNRAFLYSENDGNDATYFLVHQAEVIRRAILRLHAYIDRKSKELQDSEKLLRGWEHLNHRQIALISHALRHPGKRYTVEGHQRSHSTVYETARRDVLRLVEEGLLTQAAKGRGRTRFYAAPHDLRARIEWMPEKKQPLTELPLE
ncbi:MAG TPA: Fic family protein [Chthoniobacterales bacterium]|nr:Fic family protein [Chthoniobacterales bacterium]